MELVASEILSAQADVVSWRQIREEIVMTYEVKSPQSHLCKAICNNLLTSSLAMQSCILEN